MQEKDNQNKTQGILETVREVNEKERQREEERKIQQQKKDEAKREEYEHQLADEKVELLKLKQGVIDNSEKLNQENKEKKKYTLWQKIGNFIYHNKWWLGIAAFFVFVAGFLIYDKVTTVKSDINILLISDDSDLYQHYRYMLDYFDSNTGDYNNDGDTCANLLYIPISGDDSDGKTMMNAYDSNLSQLTTQFQLGESMMIIADSKSDELVEPEDTLANLEELFPSCPYVKRYGLYLSGTDFAKQIGYEEGNVPEDLYIGIRKPTKTLSSDKTTQDNYDLAVRTLQNIIDDLSK